jgi:drug/metabolite transporter (DMT)-like permease
MGQARLIIITALSLLAFAANSIITRLALEETAIDEASFVLLRIGSGALFLFLFLSYKLLTSEFSTLRKCQTIIKQGSWPAALALFCYAVSFTYGYGLIAAGTGALLLFGTVQITMSVIGYREGERLNLIQVSGFISALFGLVILMLPGLTTPSPTGALLMCISGMAWSIYSHLGRAAKSPVKETTGNFIKALPMALILWLVSHGYESFTYLYLDTLGIIYALLSGIVTSGIGYIIWYSVLPDLKATQAAIVQLSVPVIVTLAGAMLLNEEITLRIITAAITILFGTILVLTCKPSKPSIVKQ